MPIIDVQKRARELGRIRIGQKGDRGQPQKLDVLRFTSASQTLIAKVAELYGGEVKPWTPKGGAAQWEVITTAKRVPIMVPPTPVSQWLETWTGGGCVHRCDGIEDALTGERCAGGPLHDQAKPTTRLNVILRDVEGIGVWRLESHGWNAAIELPDVAQFLAQVGGYVNGWLSLEQRVSKSIDGEGKAQTMRYVVPTIDVDVTPAQLMAGQGRVEAPQVEGPVQQVAQIEAKAESDEDETSWRAAADACAAFDSVREVYRLATAANVEPETLAYIKARGDTLLMATSAQPEPVVGEVVTPDDDPGDPDEVWEQCVRLAGKMAPPWTLSQLVKAFKGRYDEDPDMAGYNELVSFREWLKGEAQ
jgi:hypothetical protein